MEIIQGRTITGESLEIEVAPHERRVRVSQLRRALLPLADILDGDEPPEA